MRTLLDIGSELVRLRRADGLTQAELADRVGVARQQVQRWETAAYANVSLERVSKVAEALGLSLDEPASAPLAAENRTAYGPTTSAAMRPVRDLGEIVARVRDHGTELHERFGVRSVAVFGSFARGEQTPDSDVDLVIEVEQPTLESVFGAEERLAKILGRHVESGTLGAVNPRTRPEVEQELVHVWAA
jgi:predicted nucleotidyltransferase/DNA-binding XRE family transcriptional regulator